MFLSTFVLIYSLISEFTENSTAYYSIKYSLLSGSSFYFEEGLLSEKYVLQKRNSKNKIPDEFVNNEDFMYFDQVKIDLERLFILITQSFSRSLLSTSKLLNISTGRD